jgi:hypothetical protein
MIVVVYCIELHLNNSKTGTLPNSIERFQIISKIILHKTVLLLSRASTIYATVHNMSIDIYCSSNDWYNDSDHTVLNHIRGRRQDSYRNVFSEKGSGGRHDQWILRDIFGNPNIFVDYRGNILLYSMKRLYF